MLQAKEEQPVVNVKASTFKFLLDVRASFLRFLFSGHRSYSVTVKASSGWTGMTIVAERCETFRNYCIVGCQDDKCRVETPDEAAGVGGTNPELPQQWPAGAGVVQTRRNQRIHLLPLGTGAVNCCRPSTVLRCAGRDLCGAAETEENVSQRFGTLRHTAYRQCLSGHLPRL